MDLNYLLKGRLQISMIAAMSENNIIGNNNELIWHLSEDLKRFKRLTTGKVIIMGRKTHESIGRLLPNRKTIIITRDKEYKVEGAHIAHSINSALYYAVHEVFYKEDFKLEDYSNDIVFDNEIFVIGGGEIYNMFMPIASNLYMTEIYHEFEGDTKFPKIDDSWIKTNVINMCEDQPFNYAFINYKREDGKERLLQYLKHN